MSDRTEQINFRTDKRTKAAVAALIRHYSSHFRLRRMSVADLFERLVEDEVRRLGVQIPEEDGQEVAASVAF